MELGNLLPEMVEHDTHDLHLIAEKPPAPQIKPELIRFAPSDARPIPSLKELQLPPAIEKLAEAKCGLILITGAVGSGKSAIAEAIIEQMKIRSQTNTASLLLDGLKDACDLKTALSRVESSALVLATFEAESVIDALERLFATAPETHALRKLLAKNLKAITAQKLLPAFEGHGSIAAMEIFIATCEARELIAEGHFCCLTGIMERDNDFGMTTMDDAVLSLYEQGRISYETASIALQDSDVLI